MTPGYTRLPKHLFLLLNAEPQVYGLRYEAYDGGIWLELVDRPRFQQALHGLQETIESGNPHHILLYRLLEKLVCPWRKVT